MADRDPKKVNWPLVLNEWIYASGWFSLVFVPVQTGTMITLLYVVWLTLANGVPFWEYTPDVSYIVTAVLLSGLLAWTATKSTPANRRAEKHLDAVFEEIVRAQESRRG